MSKVFEFEYNGYTFIPVGQIDPKISFKKASLYLANAYEGMLGYDWTNGGLVWSYSDFYHAASPICDTCDVFLCIETGYNYTPCQHDLMVWYGGFIPIKLMEENKNE